MIILQYMIIVQIKQYKYCAIQYSIIRNGVIIYIFLNMKICFFSYDPNYHLDDDFSQIYYYSKIWIKIVDKYSVNKYFILCNHHLITIAVRNMCHVHLQYVHTSIYIYIYIYIHSKQPIMSYTIYFNDQFLHAYDYWYMVMHDILRLFFTDNN